MLRIAEGAATPYGSLGRELTEFIRETRPELLCTSCRPRHRRSRIATAVAQDQDNSGCVADLDQTLADDQQIYR